MSSARTTGLGLMECKTLLKEADGDIKKAMTLAKEKHGKNAENRAGRATKAGRIEVYIHHDGKSGRDDRGQLRDRLRRPQRRVPPARQGPGRAGRSAATARSASAARRSRPS